MGRNFICAKFTARIESILLYVATASSIGLIGYVTLTRFLGQIDEERVDTTHRICEQEAIIDKNSEKKVEAIHDNIDEEDVEPIHDQVDEKSIEAQVNVF